MVWITQFKRGPTMPADQSMHGLLWEYWAKAQCSSGLRCSGMSLLNTVIISKKLLEYKVSDRTAVHPHPRMEL